MPLKMIFPSAGLTRPHIASSKVVFPAPLGPIKKVDVAFLHRSAKSVYGFKSVKTYRQISYFQNAIRHIHHTLILSRIFKVAEEYLFTLFELFEHIFFL